MKKMSYEQIGVAKTCRSYQEYVRMFDLTDELLSTGCILDVAGGGSSFTAEASSQGYEIYASDPRYKDDFSGWVREAAIEIETSTAKIAHLTDNFDWRHSPISFFACAVQSFFIPRCRA